mmetsp:Transcript_122988/g.382886  ORF Transcript_122988/g.382886 Transcript_122988/m.382886 type:complete len:225 (-) Transcript_122988:832-1506(-)
MGLSSLASSNIRDALSGGTKPGASASLSRLWPLAAPGASGKRICPSASPLSSSSSPSRVPEVESEPPSRACACSPISSGGTSPCESRSCLTTLDASNWSRVSMTSWPSLCEQRTQPSEPSSGPESTRTRAEGHMPRSGHGEVETSSTATMQPAVILPISALERSSCLLNTTFSRTRYLAPAFQGRWSASPSCTARMLQRGAMVDPGDMVRRWSSTTWGPKRFTG